jgi:hypothetical protein
MTEQEQSLRWIPGGVIPACPCGAPTQDQVRRRDGGARLHWHCLVCEQGRPVDDGWPDPLVAVTDSELRAITRRMEAHAAARQRRG